VAGLQFHDISKSFGAVKALTGVSFDVAAGEAHALVGENGAGKSTLLKILAGLIRPDHGHIRWQDEPFAPASPREAIDRGVGMVYQEMVTFPNLSVTGNIFAGRELTSGGLLRESAMRARTRGDMKVAPFVIAGTGRPPARSPSPSRVAVFFPRAGATS